MIFLDKSIKGGYTGGVRVRAPFSAGSDISSMSIVNSVKTTESQSDYSHAIEAIQDFLPVIAMLKWVHFKVVASFGNNAISVRLRT